MNSPFVIAPARRMIGELNAQPDKNRSAATGTHRWHAAACKRDPSAEEIETILHSLETLDKALAATQTGTRWQNGFGII
jgi:hypothetical protein